MYYNNQYYYPPVNIPSRRSYINPLNGRKNLPFKDLVLKAEKSVDTVSSLIPLYKKVQPVIEQGKSMFSNIGKLFKKGEKNKPVKEKVEAEVVEEKVQFDYRTNQNNSKPYFN